MPPASQKGTGKKGAGAVRQRSRNTTPSSVAATTASLPPIETYDAEYLELRVERFRDLTNDDVVDQGVASVMMPDTKSLDGMVARLQRLANTIELRSNFYDKGMRILAMARKNHVEEEEEVVRTDEEEREKKNRKKRKAPDSLAPQDTKPERSSPLRESTKSRKHHREESASSSLSPVAHASPNTMEVDEKNKAAGEEEEEEEESSSDEESRPPRSMVPQSHTFGDDPSTFPDPTVYEIRPVRPGMSEDEIKEIYSVARYPKSDLSDVIAGDPPDKDFSNAKPANQISFSTFSTYMEPYFRPFTEEDLAFLRERGDRVTPFTMPKRGKKHYTEIWAEEDGAMAVDSPEAVRDRHAPNQPRGSIDFMSDDVAETDKLSVGPLLSRLLSIMRPEARAPPAEDRVNGVNGDTAMSFDMNGEVPDGAADEKPNALPPATGMPESSTEAWKKASHPKLDYGQVDERIKQELRHIGFLPTDGNSEAEYDGHFDDEVSARLRLLQQRLREQVLVNGARKARLMDLVKERMAHQEYQTILEDLDTQVQGAYLKRTRTMGKSKKNKRPGGAGGGSHAVGAAGTARPGIGDLTKTLMERRKRWISTIGSVFEDESLGRVPKAAEPDSSIFKAGEMAKFLQREKEQWDEEVEEE
ncbi:related to NGG1 - general transcriptional adaptor or co-activator [Cephalotrichum gorgonifer]|uniref:Related to NGG1 - general transcriptional adaptor or co-activator n=1 Tax=Cephalotrichum gorgonifer TaxID=2041049 RepID=A0AAE8SV08_9PEZI|nr:related to NGG1 - general transcriptional adaptor or co-activator [Cephalotrichum gorgonifer]